jgi:glycine dehydrogenase
MGADVVVGSAQRFGVPMGYGGPHSAFFATKEEFKRQIPGRIIGVSIDRAGNKAYRMALQTREQHIKREKATSNICTAQVLLAVMSSFYAVYHGPTGLKNIALRTHGLAKLTAKGLEKLGLTLGTSSYFDTLMVQVDAATQAKVKALATEAQINFRYQEGAVFIAFDEAKTIADAQQVLAIFAGAKGLSSPFSAEMADSLQLEWPAALVRTSAYLTHPVFNNYHSEHEMLRYIKKLESKDLSLVHSMISLGSCTMKLNATAEMIPVTWPEFGQIHPFAPIDQTEGYQASMQD